METFSSVLAICAGNSPVNGEFPSQRPVTRSFDVFFDLHRNKRLSIQSRRRWFETPSCSLWRRSNQTCRFACTVDLTNIMEIRRSSSISRTHSTYDLRFPIFIKFVLLSINFWEQIATNFAQTATANEIFIESSITELYGVSRVASTIWILTWMFWWVVTFMWLYAITVKNDVNATKRWTVKCVFHDDVIKWKHFPRYWPFVRGVHRSPVNSPHKDQWRGALMFSLICVSINGWVNNHEAGGLRRYRAHYDITVMHVVSSLRYHGALLHS